MDVYYAEPFSSSISVKKESLYRHVHLSVLLLRWRGGRWISMCLSTLPRGVGVHCCWLGWSGGEVVAVVSPSMTAAFVCTPL